MTNIIIVIFGWMGSLKTRSIFLNPILFPFGSVSPLREFFIAFYGQKYEIDAATYFDVDVSSEVYS